MKHVYFRWDFPVLKRTNPLYFWLLAGNVVNRARASFSLVATNVRKGIMVSLVNLMRPLERTSSEVCWGFPLWEEGMLSLTIEVIDKMKSVPNSDWFGEMENSHSRRFSARSLTKILRPVCGWQILVTWSQALNFLNPPSTNADVHLPSKSRRPNNPGVVSCRKENFSLIPHANLVKNILGPCRYTWGCQWVIVKGCQY